MRNSFNNYKFNGKIYKTNLILLTILFIIVSYCSIYYLFTFTVIGIIFLGIAFAVLLFVISNLLILIFNNIYISIYDDFLEIREPYSLTKTIYLSEITSLEKLDSKLILYTGREECYIYAKYLTVSEDNSFEHLYKYLNDRIVLSLKDNRDVSNI